MTNNQLKEKILKNIESNRIWLNGFNCINPSDEFKLNLANTILDMLKNKENLLPQYLGDGDDQVDKLQKLSPTLYLSIIKS